MSVEPPPLILHIRRRPDRLLFTSPQLPGWGVATNRPTGIADAVKEGLTELDVHGYADRHGQRYDMPAADDEPPTLPPLLCLDSSGQQSNLPQWRPLQAGEMLTTKRGKAQHPCEAGSWVSPRGMVFAPHTRMARRISALRAAAGLPTTPDLPAQPRRASRTSNGDRR